MTPRCETCRSEVRVNDVLGISYCPLHGTGFPLLTAAIARNV